jgi:hypothetical protein
MHHLPGVPAKRRNTVGQLAFFQPARAQLLFLGFGAALEKIAASRVTAA